MKIDTNRVRFLRRRENTNILDIFLMICAIASLATMIINTMIFSKWTYHSDCAGYLFLAKEQLAQGKLFPNGFHYTTEIWSCGPNLTMIPWLCFLNNQYLIHELGVITYALICVVLIWILFWKNRRAALIATILFALPYSYTYNDMIFRQGAYLYGILTILLGLIAVKSIMDYSAECTIKRKVFKWVFFSVAMLFINWYSMRNYLYVTLPTLGALIGLVIIRRGARVINWLKEKKLLALISLTAALALLNLINYKVLCKQIGFSSAISMPSGLLDVKAALSNIENALAEILKLYGITGTSQLLSLHTICVCGLYVFLFVNFICMPVVLIKNIRKIDNPFYQFMSVFSVIESFVSFYMMAFAPYTIDRYFIQAQFVQMLMYSWFVVELVKHKKEEVGHWPVVLTVFLAVIMWVNGCSETNMPRFCFNQPLGDLIFHPVIETDEDEFFEEHGLDYGFATFWYSYRHMAMLNDKVTIVAYDQGSPTTPYYFDCNNADAPNYYAISEKYYDPELHPGRCFVLVFPEETIPEIYYDVAEEVIYRDDFTCLIFEKNIYVYDELVGKEK